MVDRRKKNHHNSQLKCCMQIYNHNKSSIMAVDLQPGPVLPASVLSSISESSQQISFTLAKGRSADEGGMARAQLHALGSFFVVCSIALDQSADTSQKSVLPAAFPEPSTWPRATAWFFKSLRCLDTDIDRLRNIYEKAAEIERVLCAHWRAEFDPMWCFGSLEGVC